MPGLLVLMACSLLAAGGTLGWNLHRWFGKEPILASALLGNPAEEKILKVLREMAETGKTRFAVPEGDGHRLKLLAEAVDAKNVVEVGTSTGYSALWLCLGAGIPEGRVTTFEINERIAAAARLNFRRAGVESNIAVIVGDAHKGVVTLKAPIDLVFLDADKEGYVDYLDKLLPLVRPGGLILAHNVDAAPDYVRRVTTDPALSTTRLTQASGLTVSLKKRYAGVQFPLLHMEDR